jgi:hypothetical protein
MVLKARKWGRDTPRVSLNTVAKSTLDCHVSLQATDVRGSTAVSALSGGGGAGRIVEGGGCCRREGGGRAGKGGGGQRQDSVAAVNGRLLSPTVNGQDGVQQPVRPLTEKAVQPAHHPEKRSAAPARRHHSNSPAGRCMSAHSFLPASSQQGHLHRHRCHHPSLEGCCPPVAFPHACSPPCQRGSNPAEASHALLVPAVPAPPQQLPSSSPRCHKSSWTALHTTC